MPDRKAARQLADLKLQPNADHNFFYALYLRTAKIADQTNSNDYGLAAICPTADDARQIASNEKGATQVILIPVRFENMLLLPTNIDIENRLPPGAVIHDLSTEQANEG
jgi:hypothetical protein